MDYFKNAKLSIYKAGNNSAESNGELSFEDYLDKIKTLYWQDSIIDYRNGKIKKDDLPGVTISGTFKNRKADLLLEHSGIICIDVDKKDQIFDIDIELLQKNKYLLASHLSCSGAGYALFFRINPKKHKESYTSIAEYLLKNYKINVDQAPKSPASLRFISIDQDAYFYPNANIFKEYTKTEKELKPYVNFPTVKNDFDNIIRQIKEKSINLCEDYSEWFRFSFAIAKEFGENGRSYFHIFSEQSTKYDTKSCDKLYDIALKRKGDGVTMASIYYHCKNANIDIVSKETKQIKSIIKLSNSTTEAHEKLTEIGLNQDFELIDKLTPKKNETVFDEIIELIKFENVRFNEITRNYEFNGIPMTDRVLARFYSKCWVKIDEDLSKDKIFTTIENPDNTISYNPIRYFFEEHYNYRPIGNIRKLIECFTIDHTTLDENGNTFNANSYLEIFLLKWLVSIIGSAHGTYSLMILVLSGEQRNNKTIFFRELLPPQLRAYYSENSLDQEKDSEILMTKKLIIMDDEFGGKSKKDSNKLKRLSSQQTFSVRKPYGKTSEDLERLAVLCGTSNDVEIINDPTGNRRIIPINLISLDVDKFRGINKVDLFMELYHIWEKDKEGWFLSKEEIAYLNKATVKNTAVITEEELINKEFEFYEYGQMTNTDVKIYLETKYPMLRTTSTKLGLCLRKLGYISESKKVDGKTFRCYPIKQILY